MNRGRRRAGRLPSSGIVLSTCAAATLGAAVGVLSPVGGVARAGSVPAVPARASRHEVARLPDGLRARDIVFSRGGGYLVAFAVGPAPQYETALLAWSRTEKRWTRLPATHEVAFPSHDRWWILVLHQSPHKLAAYDLKKHRVRTIATMSRGPMGMALSPDDRWVAVGQDWTTRRVGRRVEGGAVVNVTEPGPDAYAGRILLWRVSDGRRRSLTRWCRSLATRGQVPSSFGIVFGWSTAGGLAVRTTLDGPGPTKQDVQVRIDPHTDRLIAGPRNDIAWPSVANSRGGCATDITSSGRSRILYASSLGARSRSAFTYQNGVSAGHDQGVGFALADRRDYLLTWGAAPLAGKAWRVSMWGVPLASCRATEVYGRTVRIPQHGATGRHSPEGERPSVIAAVDPLGEVAALVHSPDLSTIHIVRLR